MYMYDMNTVSTRTCRRLMIETIRRQLIYGFLCAVLLALEAQGGECFEMGTFATSIGISKRSEQDFSSGRVAHADTIETNSP